MPREVQPDRPPPGSRTAALLVGAVVALALVYTPGVIAYAAARTATMIPDYKVPFEQWMFTYGTFVFALGGAAGSVVLASAIAAPFVFVVRAFRPDRNFPFRSIALTMTCACIIGASVAFYVGVQWYVAPS